MRTSECGDAASKRLPSRSPLEELVTDAPWVAAVDAYRARSPRRCDRVAEYDRLIDAGIFGVFGVIQASGLILMGDRGFRAERAEVVAVVTRNRRVAAACTEQGIAVYRRRRDLLKDYPPEDLSALLDDQSADTDADDTAPPSAPRSPRGFGLALCLAVWARAALVALVAVMLPIAVAIVTAVMAELALIVVVGTRLRR